MAKTEDDKDFNETLSEGGYSKSQIKKWLRGAGMSMKEFKERVKATAQDAQLKDKIANKNYSAYCAAGVHDKCKGHFVGSKVLCECPCHKQLIEKK